jgi:hypothetical protein
VRGQSVAAAASADSAVRPSCVQRAAWRAHWARMCRLALTRALPSRDLFEGAEGNDVLALQDWLAASGYLQEEHVDG